MRIAIDTYKRKAQAYFRKCDRANGDANGKLTKPYTLSGLLCDLELTREQFFSLKKSREGRRFVNSTLTKIEAFIEENALNGKISSSAAANSLKYSLGWTDKEEEEERADIVVTLSKEAQTLAQ